MSLHVILNSDTGNSSTKIIVTNGNFLKARKQTSVIAFMSSVPQFEDAAESELVANLHNNMIVNITSKAITQNGLYAVGQFASANNGRPMDIELHKKAHHNLSVIQPLTMLATSMIQQQFEATGELQDVISLTVEYMGSIPLVDYSKSEAQALEKRLTGKHVLIVYIDENKSVTVSLEITRAKIVAEGIPAFYSLVNSDNAMIGAYNGRYGLKYKTSDFIARKMLFVDIGDGTTELIYIAEGKPVIAKSTGFKLGVGHTTNKASEVFKSENNFRAALSRNDFMSKVLNTNDKWHREVMNAIDSVKFEQENEIFNAIVKTVEHKIQFDLDDIVVFGGGTNIFTGLEKLLYEYTDHYNINVLWIAEKESSLMGVRGLSELSRNVFFKGSV